MAEIIERIETTKMSSRGQIVIPGSVRKRINAREGSIFVIAGQGDTLVLKKVEMPRHEELINAGKTAGKKEDLSINKIIKILKANREEIEMYSVKKLGVFGSFLKGKQKKESDIDILVEFGRTNFDNFMGLKLFLEKLFGRKVDLIVERTLKPEFKYVKKEAKYVRY